MMIKYMEGKKVKMIVIAETGVIVGGDGYGKDGQLDVEWSDKWCR